MENSGRDKKNHLFHEKLKSVAYRIRVKIDTKRLDFAK